MIRSVKSLMEGSPALTVRTGEWDSDPHLLNTPDGVVDLRTGQLLSHDPSLLMRGMTLVAPNMLDGNDYARMCPKWLMFVNQIAYGRQHVAPLLQRWFGYCLTGRITHQNLLFLQGLPGTGKSQLLTVILLLIASYAVKLRQSWILKNPDKRFDMVPIMGKRFGFMDETQKGASWDETRASDTASAEMLKAEFKGGDEVEFTNQIKLNIAGNHHPRFVSGEAGGLMRRMLLLEMINPPFYGSGDAVEDYARMLVDEEGPGILAWCIEGARLDYADDHQLIFHELRRPLEEAARDYARESDPVREWVESEMELGKDHSILLRDAFALFNDWLQQRQQRDHSSARMTRTDFKTALRAAFPSIEHALVTARKDQGVACINGIGRAQGNFDTPADAADGE